ncbi:MAG: hypothetical protein R2941_10120 [Desulfobacterales bacterium]
MVSSKPEIVPVNTIYIGGLFTDLALCGQGSDLSVHIIDTSMGPKTLTMKFTRLPISQE